MKNFLFNKKVLISIILFILLIFISNISKAMTHYQTVGTTTGFVTADALNVRQGPGTNFGIVTKVYKNEYIRLFGKIGDWYVVQTDKDFLGAVSSKYIKLIYPNTTSGNTGNNQGSGNTSTNTGLSADEQEVFDLINAKRVANRFISIKD